MGEEVQLHIFLTSVLDGGKWSVSRPGRFTSRERALGTQRTGGWIGPRAVLDSVAKRKIHRPCRESNPGRPARSLVAILTVLYTWLSIGISEIIMNGLERDLLSNGTKIVFFTLKKMNAINS
jgi:hypothetical protein